MKKIKKQMTIELPENVWRTLERYGYDFEKNFEQEAINTAYYIWCEEANDDQPDVGTETAREVRRQNGEE